jgi:hypothetical protein
MQPEKCRHSFYQPDCDFVLYVASDDRERGIGESSNTIDANFVSRTCGVDLYRPDWRTGIASVEVAKVSRKRC